MFLLKMTQQKMLAKFLTHASLCILALIASWYWHRGEVEDVKKEVTISLTNEYQSRLSELKNESLLAEIQLKAKLEEIQNAKTKQKAIDDSRINSLISSLHNRHDRPTGKTDIPGSTSNSATIEGSTGVQLYRSDGEFLVRFAGMAAELQRELNSCVYNYNTVRNELNSFKVKHEF